jgi:hypothetical protein
MKRELLVSSASFPLWRHQIIGILYHSLDRCNPGVWPRWRQFGERRALDIKGVEIEQAAAVALLAANPAVHNASIRKEHPDVRMIEQQIIPILNALHKQNLSILNAAPLKGISNRVAMGPKDTWCCDLRNNKTSCTGHAKTGEQQAGKQASPR